MKKYIKTYLLITICSIMVAVLPWVLTCFDVLSKLSVLESYGIIFAIIALIAAWIGLSKLVQEAKPRVIMFLCNPVIYYLIVLIAIVVMFAMESMT